MNAKWNNANVIEELSKQAEKNNGVIIISDIPKGIIKYLRNNFGNATLGCKALGFTVKNPKSTHRLAKFEVKKDCMMYDKGKCSGLIDLFCKYENCKFYKQRVGE